MNKKIFSNHASTWLTVLIFIALLAAMFGSTHSVTAQEIFDGNNTLGQSFVYTLTGGVTVAGVGLRGVGSGNINLTGVPAGATVFRAHLYWATLGNSNTYTQPSLDGNLVSGRLIGTTGDTGWFVQNNFVYRADVTDLVSGNGTYTISGLPSDRLAGNDSQGASLVVIYRDNTQPRRTILINDGAVALNGIRPTHTNTITGFEADSPVSEAKVTYLVGDGQAIWDDESILFNGTSIANGVFSGVDGDYWGSHTFDVTDLMTDNIATTTLRITGQDTEDPDYLLWAATIFSITASAPATTNQLSQNLNQTFFGDVTSAGVGLRGTGIGTINLSGIPDNSYVHQAFLYWATLGNSSGYTNPQLDGYTVNGEVIGTSADTCWGAAANYVYRADVTNLVRDNGDYTISGLPDDLAAGNDSQGASLVVIFGYGITGLYRTIIINDGAVTLDLVTNSYTDTLGDFFADQPTPRTHMTYLIGDGQSEWDSGSISFEGQPIAGSVFTGIDGDFWGTLRFDVTGLINEPDATTTINNDAPGTDCLLWAASILSVETEPPVFDHFIYLPLIIK
jgi:hypothetical protein